MQDVMMATQRHWEGSRDYEILRIPLEFTDEEAEKIKANWEMHAKRVQKAGLNRKPPGQALKIKKQRKSRA